MGCSLRSDFSPHARAPYLKVMWQRNMHRYKVKFNLKNFHGDREFEFLGTWIGFAGMLFVIGCISFYEYPKPAVANSVPIVAAAFAVYWLATQIRFLIVIFCILSLLASVLFLVFSITSNIDCSQIINTRQQLHCIQDNLYPRVAFTYLTSLFLVSLYYSVGYFRRAT
ncbi:hypothetical protein ALT761_00543 [Alteromonas sp. 76-1]|uniref:hypothetical protein n=1 Tax=Alteromonas sp. 76-1 TaxID=2358187 RepID=UPI000FD174DF|nr:hypothetical protein [Alteromonas sp. 76-1]VEL95588.1 hypothetical protein ALT761_00543 [Alteromonas sp. 76-1]